jgi:hypothetical protein
MVTLIKCEVCAVLLDYQRLPVDVYLAKSFNLYEALRT